MDTLNEEALWVRVNKVKWYHTMEVPGTSIVTHGHSLGLEKSWNWIKEQLNDLHARKLLKGPALDIGCRDGMFSFWLEDNGIEPVTGIDNNISEGIGLMRELRGSKLTIREKSVYSLDRDNQFRTVLFMGVLYHLRYPINGISAVVGATQTGGIIVVESGFYGPNDEPLIHCPVTTSPWDATSCTFFNLRGLDETFASFGCKRVGEAVFMDHGKDDHTLRGMAVYTKCREMRFDYWEGIHRDYTNLDESASSRLIRSEVAEL